MTLTYDQSAEAGFPWSHSQTDDRFARILKWIFTICIIIGITIPWLPSPEIEKKQLKQVSPRLAKLITQKRLQKPKVPQLTALKKKTIKPKAKKKVRSKKQVKAKKKAQQSGLMAMSNDIQDLQGMFETSTLQKVKPLRSAATKSKASSTSSVLSRKASKSSGGIDTTKLSRSGASSKLAGRKNTQVTSNISNKKTRTYGNSSSSGSARDPEEVTLIFDKYKGALEALYIRTLRKDPGLQGKVVFELTINAAGKVIKCKILSSELGSKSLERRLVSRVKSFRFPAKNVKTVTVTFPIDFLPS